MKLLYVYIIFLFFHVSYSQELPPILNISSKEYSAGNQNWMITQDESQQIYVANNFGLLSFNGEQWKLHKLPSASYLRSVKYTKGKVFSGSYMDFGYWQKDNTGDLVYTSLKDLVEVPFLDGEQFWHIETVDNYVVFQSLRRLYSYNLKTNKVVVMAANYAIYNLFKSDNKLYYQVAEEGLYVIDNGERRLAVENSEINNQIIVGLFKYLNEDYVVTRNSKIFKLSNKRLFAVSFPDLNFASDESIFTANLINDKILALGTIGNGLKLYNFENQHLTHFKQPSILNNTILSVYCDSQGNLWSGLDNGLSVINLNNKVQIFSDIYGEIGTVYCSLKHNGILYLGTNQGLYAKNYEEKGPFKLIPKTSGQVWTIQIVKNNLLVGHNKGTFLIENFSAEHIYEGSGTWDIVPYGDHILQGHYNGLSLGLLENNKITAFKNLSNYSLSSRNIIVRNNKEIWVGHDHKGIFKLKINNEEANVVVEKSYEFNSPGGTGTTIYNFNNELYVSTKDSIFKYNSTEDAFFQADNFNKLFKDTKRITGMSKVIETNSWFGFGQEYVYQVSKDAFQGDLTLTKIPIPSSLRGITTGFENISYLGENKYLIGSNFGFVIFTLPFNQPALPDLKINSVKIATKTNEFQSISVNSNSIELPFQKNYINFSYAIPNFNLLNVVKYSYKLKGYNEEWSSWSDNSEASFKNLPYGDYAFTVKAKLNDENLETQVYTFSILKPWYLSTLAIAVYILIFLSILWSTHVLYNRYYSREQEKIIEENKEKLKMQELSAQQEIFTLKNKQLVTEVEAKNRELAASTMNIIKKNEFLSDLKNKLDNSKTAKDIEEVISIINKNIAEKDNWKLFKEAFDNADKDFLKSVKEKHPNLTANDLKLCAYLRLNLTSKEIAPMLNISLRSVEIKRYRLRKKMELDHEQGLTEYILSF